jgi:hypothetical protein
MEASSIQDWEALETLASRVISVVLHYALRQEIQSSARIESLGIA